MEHYYWKKMVFLAMAVSDLSMKVRLFELGNVAKPWSDIIIKLFAGIHIADGHEVAIKFVNVAKRNEALREFQMFFYLKAYKKPEVEQFGIPAIYYYGEWENFIAMAMTKLDKSLYDVCMEPHEFTNPLDALIFIRQFVSALYSFLIFPQINLIPFYTVISCRSSNRSICTAVESVMTI